MGIEPQTFDLQSNALSTWLHVPDIHKTTPEQLLRIPVNHDESLLILLYHAMWVKK